MASSSELEQDRIQFELLLARLNDDWMAKGFYLKLTIWENFLDAMAIDGLQSTYNKAVSDCDIFVMLYFTKVGMYTQQEFETAFGQFKNTGRPFVYTFFKNAPINTGDLVKSDILSLFSFQEKLHDLKHFYTRYKNIEDLKLRFTDQLNKLINEGHIRKNQVDLDPSLRTILDNEKSYCKINHIRIYAANLLNALLQNKNGYLFAILNQLKKGYAELLSIKLKKIIEDILNANLTSNQFVDQDWFDREDVQIAAKYAESENKKYISERHLLQGIIEKGGNTVNMIRSDLQGDYWIVFLEMLKRDNANFTPFQ